MTRLAKQFLVLVVLAICCIPHSAHPQANGSQDTDAVRTEPLQIDRIEIRGNRHIDTAALRLQLTSRTGAISRDTIAHDIRTLYATGFFDQVKASFVRDGREGVLRFSLVEKPLLRKVFVRGNKEISEEELAGVLQVSGRRFLDRARIDALARTVALFYQSRGYYDVAVDSSVVPVGQEQVDLILNVTEGPIVRLRKVRVEGLSELDEDEVLDVIETGEYRWWSSWLFGTGQLRQDLLQADQAKIRQYLLDHGFIDGSVGDPLVQRTKDGLEVVFPVQEGPRYVIGEIRVQGDLIDDSPERTLEGITTSAGDIFNASQIREDAFRVSEKFTDRGYAFANVVPSTDIARNAHTVDIDFLVDKGPEVRVNRIEIRGNEKTFDNVIRRELRIEEQAQYSSGKIRRSQQLLQRLGYFEEVNIATEPTDRPDEVDLQVNVREAATGQFSAGVGYSTSDGGLFNIRLSEDNIAGTGRRAVLNLDLGTERDNYVISLTDPRVFDSYVSAGVDILRTEREFIDFDRALTGGSMQVGYPLEQLFGEWGQDIHLSLQYQYLRINISDVDVEDVADLVAASEGESSSSSITPRLVRNTINNPLDPTSGSRQSLSFEIAGLGGDEEFFLVEARNQYYRPLWNSPVGPFVFSWRFTAGYGESLNDNPFPLFRRYFPGGINSVRGFRARRLGPKDSLGNEYGGSKELVNNLELIFPLVNSAGLRGVTFFDIGQAFDDDQRIEFDDLRQAYGVGLRWSSPLGPIRLEFGFPIDREPGESSMVTLFAFGTPF